MRRARPCCCRQPLDMRAAAALPTQFASSACPQEITNSYQSSVIHRPDMSLVRHLAFPTIAASGGALGQPLHCNTRARLHLLLSPRFFPPPRRPSTALSSTARAPTCLPSTCPGLMSTGRTSTRHTTTAPMIVRGQGAARLPSVAANRPPLTRGLPGVFSGLCRRRRAGDTRRV